MPPGKGRDVALVFRPEELRESRPFQHEIEGLGQHVLLIPGEVSDPELCRRAVERTLQDPDDSTPVAGGSDGRPRPGPP
jgi:hypothetical protein